MNRPVTFDKAVYALETGGKRLQGEVTAPVASGSLRWELCRQDDRFTLLLHTDEEAVLDTVTATFICGFSPDDRLFLNGYQSWTDSREHTGNGKMRGLDHLPRALVDKYAFTPYGDYAFVPYGKRRGQLHGFSYGYIRQGETYLFFGSLAEESGFTLLRFDTRAGTLTLEKDCRGHHLTGDYTVFDLCILRGSEQAVFDRWFALMGVAPAAGKRLDGYTSWYNRYENITEQTIAADLAGFAAGDRLPAVFQIDDGYETAVGDWLQPDPVKFPSGMAAAASRIREAGMTPGLWLAPFAAQKNAVLVTEHPDWVLRDPDGQPVVGGGNWGGFYALNIYHPGVQSYLRQVFDTVINRWGYGLVKLDFLYAACLLPRPDKTRAQVMFDAMRLLRQWCGDALILGCGVPLVPAFGLVDYCRIGCDVSLSWDDKWFMRLMHRERPSTKNTLLNTVFRRQLDRRAFRNDPDVFLLREDNLHLNWPQKRALAVINALFGGVLFTSDDPARYPPAVRQFYDGLQALDASCLTGLEFDGRRLTLRWRQEEGEQTLTLRV